MATSPPRLAVRAPEASSRSYPHGVISSHTGVGFDGPLSAGQAYTAQIAGQAGIPAGVSAVFANVRILSASTNSSYKIAPTGTSLSTTPTSGYYGIDRYNDAGQTLKLGSDGKIKIALGAGSANIIIDVQGYFTAGAEGGSFTSLAGNNVVYDSRDTVALAANEDRVIQVTGVGQVPTGSGVDSVALSTVAMRWGATGSLSVFNPDHGASGTSNVGFMSPYDAPVQTTALVQVSNTGKVTVRNNSSAPVTVRLAAQGFLALPPTVAPTRPPIWGLRASKSLEALTRILQPFRPRWSTWTGTWPWPRSRSQIPSRNSRLGPAPSPRQHRAGPSASHLPLGGSARTIVTSLMSWLLTPRAPRPCREQTFPFTTRPR